MGKVGSRGRAWGGRRAGLRAECGPFCSLPGSERRAGLRLREDALTARDAGWAGAEPARPRLERAAVPALRLERRRPPGAESRPERAACGPAGELRGGLGAGSRGGRGSSRLRETPSLHRFNQNVAEFSEFPSEARKVREWQAGPLTEGGGRGSTPFPPQAEPTRRAGPGTQLREEVSREARGRGFAFPG